MDWLSNQSIIFLFIICNEILQKLIKKLKKIKKSAVTNNIREQDERKMSWVWQHHKLASWA